MGSKLSNMVLFLVILVVVSAMHFFEGKLSINTVIILSGVAIAISCYFIIRLIVHALGKKS